MSKTINEHESNYWHIRKMSFLTMLNIIGIAIWIVVSVYGIHTFHKYDFGIVIGSTLLFIVVAFGCYLLGAIRPT